MIKVGDSSIRKVKFTDAAVRAFAELSGDTNPIHLDEDFAKNSIFKKRIVHGMLVSGLISAVIANDLPGPGSIYLQQNLNFCAPVYIDEVVEAIVVVKTIRKDKPIVTLSTICKSDGKIVIEGEAIVKLP
ncbi:MaoC family dehydratase [Fulvivirga lutimaris]|uniref:MaoC family dehydratase n=1 Tax=Fulvivirga lutimaris TaxID=1819566 RepID=UPI0012BD149A|nr:MaoC family dehydratase [Fulvivirga lutimaris]MTI38251.1 MaoC family dehydratase [Fulvivirga lutimaris]